MRRTIMTRFFGLMLLAGLAAGLVSCAEDRAPTTAVSMQSPQDQALLGELLRPLGLLQCRPLPYDRETRVIGPKGGVIFVGPHMLVIPEGALDSAVTITAEAPVGTVNSVRFYPHGLEFNRPAALTMSYANCDLLGRLLPKRIAYTTENLEILYYLLSLDLSNLKKVTGRVDHFSRYAVSW